MYGIADASGTKAAISPHGIFRRLLGLEFGPLYSGLADDGLQGADADFGMIGNGNGDGSRGCRPLHHNVAAAPPDLDEVVAREDRAYVLTGQDPQSTQPRPRPG